MTKIMDCKKYTLLKSNALIVTYINQLIGRY